MLIEKCSLDITSNIGRWRTTTISQSSEDDAWRDSVRLQYRRFKQDGILAQDHKDPDTMPIPIFDKWDTQSVRFLLTQKSSKQDLGTLRFIFEGRLPLQVEEVCRQNRCLRIYRSAIAECPGRIAEVSAFSRMKSEDACVKSLPVAHEMMRAVYHASLKYDIETWVGVFDPALQRLLKSYGFVFRVCREVRYHGKRYVCIAVREDLRSNLAITDPKECAAMVAKHREYPLSST